MKRILLLLGLAYSIITVYAQITIGRTPERYYLSLAEMNTEHGIGIPFIDPVQNANTGMLQFRPDDKALRKTLKKDARIIVHQDSLYLNLRKLSYQGFGFDTGYVQAWSINDSTLLFFAPDNGWKAAGKAIGVGLLSAGLTMGMTGGMLAVYPIALGNWACYIYQGDNPKVKRVNRELATQLLEEANPLLYFDYKALSDYNQKQQSSIKQYLYKMVHEM